MSKLKQLLCWILAIAVFISTAAPGGFAITARAEADLIQQTTAPTENETTPTMETTAPVEQETTAPPVETTVPECEETTSPAEEETTAPTPEEVSVTFTAENSIVTDTEGNPMETEFKVMPGTAIAFQVAPDGEYAMTKVYANEIPMHINAQGVYAMTVEQNTEIHVSSILLEQPPVTISQRQENGWSQTANYLVTVCDEICIMSVQLLNVNRTPARLTLNEDGTYTATINGNGTYAIRVSEINGYSAVSYITETQVDNAPPTIELLRLSEGWVELAKYCLRTEDTQSGISTVVLSKADSEDILLLPDENNVYVFQVEVGEPYTLTITDNAGNIAAQELIDGEKDVTPPKITDLQRSSSGWHNSAVTYTFTVEETQSGISSVVLTGMDDAPAELIPDDNGEFSITLEENRTVYVTMTDCAGNSAQHIISETQIDKDAPVMSDPLRVQTGWCQAAKYTFTAMDSISGIADIAVFDLDGNPLEHHKNADGSYEITISHNGTYVIRVTDNAGNDVTFTLEESQIDTTAPVICDVTRTESGWAKQAVYTFTVTESQSGVMGVFVSVDGEKYQELIGEAGVYTFCVAQNQPFEIRVKDNAGNIATYNATESEIDNTPPAISEVFRANDGWTKQAQYYFSVADLQSGILSVSVSDGETEIVLTANEQDMYSFSVTENGTYIITAIDVLGNTSSQTIEEAQIDYTAPVIDSLTRHADGWQYEAQYRFEVKDQQSGVAEVKILDENGEEIPYTQEGSLYSFTLTYNTAFTIQASDTAGNSAQMEVNESHIDRVAPVLSDQIREEEGWTDTAVYHFTVSDNQSGIMSVIWICETGESEMLLSTDGNYTVTISSNGTYTIMVTDKAGNTVSQSITETQVDTTDPEITELTRTESAWATKTDYTFMAADTQSGIASVTVTIGNNEPITLTAVEGVYRFTLEANTSYEICVADFVGNRTYQGGEEVCIDTTAPTVTEPIRNAEGWQFCVTYSFTAEDMQSGVQSVTVNNADGIAYELLPDGNGTYTFDANNSGTYAITVSDSVGNKTQITVEETLVDIEAPAIADISRETEQWAQNTVYSFFVKDTQSGVASVKVYLANEEQELTCDESGMYEFAANANGTYKIIAVDMVGNAMSVMVAENRIDQIAPVIHSILPQAEWDAHKNTVTFDVSDESALALVYVMDEAQTRCYELTKLENNRFKLDLYSNGNYTVLATDEAGNTVTAGFTVWHIDTEKPSAPVLSSSSLGWTNKDVTVYAVSSDTQSGVVRYWYSCDNKSFDPDTWHTMNMNDGAGITVFSAEQNTDYFVVAEDGVGQISDVSVIHVSIDKTAPAELLAQLTMDENSGYHGIDGSGRPVYKDKVSFHAAAADLASGIASYDYRIVDSQGDQKVWIGIEANELGISPVISSLKDGIYTIYVAAYDVAGNRSKEIRLAVNGNVVDFVLENTPSDATQRYPFPSVDMLTDGDPYRETWTNSNVTIRVYGSHAVSGIHHYEYRVDYANPALSDSLWEAIPGRNGVAELSIQKDTNATYYFRAITYAGNTTQETSRTILIQKTLPPVGVITPEQATGNNGWYTKLPGYETTLPDQDPYMAPVQYSFLYTHNGNEEKTIAVESGRDVKIGSDGIWVLRLVTEDIAGNKVISNAYTFMVDTKVPDGLDVILDDISILNGDEQNSYWNAVNILDRVIFTDFDIFKHRELSVQISADGGDSGLAQVYYQAVPYNELYNKDGTWMPVSGNSVTLAADGKYHLFFKAVDVAGNTSYFSARSIIVDSQAPSGADSDAVTIVADVSNKSGYGFYNSDVTFDIRVLEPMNGDAVVFSGLKTIRYRVLANGTVTQSGQVFPGFGETVVTEGRISEWCGSVIIDAGSSNYDNVTLEITAIDMSGNVRVTKAAPVNIDTTAPVIHASYDKNSTFTSYEGVSCFYGDRTLTVICTEKHFVPSQSFVYVRETDSDSLQTYEWVSDGDAHKVIIPITEDGHYEVSAKITDAARNTADTIFYAVNTVAGDRFILDNIAPVITATHADNDVKNDRFFASDRTIVIKVVERNFIPELISMDLSLHTEDGRTKKYTLPEWHSDGITHTATITLTESGIYHFTISGMDAVNNHAKDVSYMGASAREWVIDKRIDSPLIECVDNGGEYANSIAPVITATDKNLHSLNIRLFHTAKEETRKDVTDKYITAENSKRKEIVNGVELTLDIFPLLQEYDGLYTIVATATDKAGNATQSEVSFTINRFGSLYVYDNALTELVGTSMKNMPTDIIITEINPSAVVDGSVQVIITNDGMPTAAPIFSVEKLSDGTGWYKYRYVISKENFTADGAYEVVLSTRDTAGNFPENTAEGYQIRFSIDNEAPMLTSIIGMEQKIVKANSHKVMLTATDNIQLCEVSVYIDGIQVVNWDNIKAYEGNFTFEIPECLESHVRIVVKDIAGNITDTDEQTFIPGYGFNREITVSSNAFLRFYANKPIFFGSVGILGAAIFLLLILLRKKKNRTTK